MADDKREMKITTLGYIDFGHAHKDPAEYDKGIMSLIVDGSHWYDGTNFSTTEIAYKDSKYIVSFYAQGVDSTDDPELVKGESASQLTTGDYYGLRVFSHGASWPSGGIEPVSGKPYFREITGTTNLPAVLSAEDVALFKAASPDHKVISIYGTEKFGSGVSSENWTSYLQYHGMVDELEEQQKLLKNSLEDLKEEEDVDKWFHHSFRDRWPSGKYNSGYPDDRIKKQSGNRLTKLDPNVGLSSSHRVYFPSHRGGHGGQSNWTFDRDQVSYMHQMLTGKVVDWKDSGEAYWPKKHQYRLIPAQPNVYEWSSDSTEKNYVDTLDEHFPNREKLPIGFRPRANSDNLECWGPPSVPYWKEGTTYSKGTIVYREGRPWRSLQDNNNYAPPRYGDGEVPGENQVWNGWQIATHNKYHERKTYHQDGYVEVSTVGGDVVENVHQDGAKLWEKRENVTVGGKTWKTLWAYCGSKASSAFDPRFLPLPRQVIGVGYEIAYQMKGNISQGIYKNYSNTNGTRKKIMATPSQALKYTTDGYGQNGAGSWIYDLDSSANKITGSSGRISKIYAWGDSYTKYREGIIDAFIKGRSGKQAVTELALMALYDTELGGDKTKVDMKWVTDNLNKTTIEHELTVKDTASLVNQTLESWSLSAGAYRGARYRMIFTPHLVDSNGGFAQIDSEYETKLLGAIKTARMSGDNSAPHLFLEKLEYKDVAGNFVCLGGGTEVGKGTSPLMFANNASNPSYRNTDDYFKQLDQVRKERDEGDTKKAKPLSDNWREARGSSNKNLVRGVPGSSGDYRTGRSKTRKIGAYVKDTCTDTSLSCSELEDVCTKCPYYSDDNHAHDVDGNPLYVHKHNGTIHPGGPDAPQDRKLPAGMGRSLLEPCPQCRGWGNAART